MGGDCGKNLLGDSLRDFAHHSLVVELLSEEVVPAQNCVEGFVAGLLRGGLDRRVGVSGLVGCYDRPTLRQIRATLLR